MNAIPFRDVTTPRREHAPHYDAPYRLFIAASLALGIGGGFLLSLLLPLARTLDWNWGSRSGGPSLVQVHGQLQLIGFGGLFVMGMALRLMPRVSGRPLASAITHPRSDSVHRGLPLPALLRSAARRRCAP